MEVLRAAAEIKLPESQAKKLTAFLQKMKACPETKSLIFQTFYSRLDRWMSLFQVNGTAEAGSAARQSSNFPSGWSYRTGS